MASLLSINEKIRVSVLQRSVCPLPLQQGLSEAAILCFSLLGRNVLKLKLLYPYHPVHSTAPEVGDFFVVSKEESFSNQDESTAPLVMSVLVSLLERTMARNERILRKCQWVLSPRASSALGFDSHETPDIEIQSYLKRRYPYAHVAPPVYVVAYVYID